MTAVAQAWERIESWLDTNAKDLKRGLRKPVTDNQWAKLVERFSAIPADLEASFRLHDGETGDGGAFAGWTLLSVTKSLREAKRTEAAYPEWIPITSGSEGQGHFVRPDGSVAIQDGEVRDVAPSWTAFLEAFASQLERGRFVVGDDGTIRDLDGGRGTIATAEEREPAGEAAQAPEPTAPEPAEISLEVPEPKLDNVTPAPPPPAPAPPPDPSEADTVEIETPAPARPRAPSTGPAKAPASAPDERGAEKKDGAAGGGGWLRGLIRRLFGGGR